jgi:hypothetical protein
MYDFVEDLRDRNLGGFSGMGIPLTAREHLGLTS